MMAFVVYEDPGTGDTEVCSGTVVSPRLVLTAGHCAFNTATGTEDQPAGYAVVTGSLGSRTSPARQVSAVTRTILNPAYNAATGDGDAALLVLGTPTTTPPVPLADPSADLSLVNAGASAQIAGWGRRWRTRFRTSCSGALGLFSRLPIAARRRHKAR